MTNSNRAMSERRVREIARNEMQALLRKTKTLDESAVQELSDLDDADTAGALDDDVLSYNVGSSTWIPRTLPAGVSELSDLDDVVVASPSDGDILTYNESESRWDNLPPGFPDLDELNDVHVPTPADGEVLAYNNATARWEAATPTGGGASELSDLSDVDTTGVTDGQILTFNNTAGEWQPDAAPTGGGASELSDLSDVDTTGVADGQILTFNNTAGEWQPEDPSAGLNFSTSEQDTGLLWIDGKPIFRKTINFGALPNATTKSVAHGISNLNTVIHFIGTARNSSSVIFTYIPLPYQSTASVSAQILVAATNTNILMDSGSNWSAWSGWVTLLYVKD